MSAKINYLAGNEPAKWRTGLATYRSVAIRSLYQGIDLVCYGNQEQLEYDFTVAPGAHPEDIAMRFEGADRITISPEGELVLHIGNEEIRQLLPTVYQVINGGRKTIAGKYRLSEGQDTVTFELGEYDHHLPLVIDPVLTYSSYFGGKVGATFSAIKVDSSGNVYVAGTTLGQINLTTLAPGFHNPGFQTNFQGGRLDGDAFVAKFDNTLTNLIFLTYIGGSTEDGAYDMALDSSNNIYLTGFTDSANFPTKVPDGLTNSLPHAGKIGGSFSVTFNSYPVDAFVTELDSSGSSLVYSIYLGGTNDDVAEGIAVDAAGNAYVTGYTLSTNTFTSTCVTNSYPCGCTNIFLLVTCTNVPTSTNFPITPNAFQNLYFSTNGSPDAFLVRLAAGGTNLDYASYLGESETVTMQLAESNGAKQVFFDVRSPTYGVGVAANGQTSDGIAYVTGFTSARDFPTTANALQQSFQLNNSTNGAAVIATNLTAPSDAFLARFDTTQSGSNSLAFSTLLGGTNDDAGSRVTVDGFTTNVYVTGYTKSADFTNSAGTNVLGLYSGLGTNVGLTLFNSDVFLAKFGPDDVLKYSVVYGGGNNDVAWDVALDPTASTLGLVGFTTASLGATNFPTVLASRVLSATNHGLIDVFATVFTSINSTLPTVVYSVLFGGSGNDYGYGIALDSQTNAYIAGRTFSKDFPTNQAIQAIHPANSSGFLSKIQLTNVQIAISIQSVPTNLIVILDGTNYQTPVTFMDFPGYPHTISTLLVQTNAADVLEVWTAWSDHGTLTHVIAPTSDASFTNFFEAPPFNTVAVITNGFGTVSPNFNKQMLQIGHTYKMTATPSANYVFAGWSGSLTTNSPTLIFTMTNGLVLEANFILSPFIFLSGSYSGLFSDTNGVAFGSSGFFSATLNPQGKFTAKIQLAGKITSFSGQFSNDGFYSNCIPRSGLSPLCVSMQVDFTGTNMFTVVGQISPADSSFTSVLQANRAAYGNPTTASLYSLAVTGGTNSVDQPGGNGFGTLTVDGLGGLRFSGTLADNTKIAQSVFLSPRGQWPFYASLYSGKGSLLGWLTFTNLASTDVSGQLTWFKPAQAGASLYPLGFTNQPQAMGSSYSTTFFASSNGNPVLSFTNGGLVALQGAGLAQDVTNRISIAGNNKVTNLDTNHLTLSFNTFTGLFHGSVLDPASRATISFNGVVLQKQTNGFGFFIHTNQSGSVLLLPTPP